MGDGQSVYLYQTHFADSHIVVRLLGFDPTSGQCRLAIDENSLNIGFYYIWVTFASGDETRIDYDGGNPNRNNRPIIKSNHVNDSLSGIRAKRVIN